MLLWAAAAFAGQLGIDWERPVRYQIDNEVHLPTYVWMRNVSNNLARMSNYKLQMVLDCAAGEQQGRVMVRECEVEAASLSGAAIVADAGKLAPMLPEMSEKLAERTLKLSFRKDGRLVAAHVRNLDRLNGIEGANNERVRQLVRLAVAGLSLDLRHATTENEGVWGTGHTAIFTMPNVSGNLVVGDQVHQTRQSDGRMTEVVTGGEAVIEPGNTLSRYDLSLSGYYHFDQSLGALVSRRWMVKGEATPGSLVAQGFEAMPFLSYGSISLLQPDTEVNLSEPVETNPPGAFRESLRPWSSFLGSP